MFEVDFVVDNFSYFKDFFVIGFLDDCSGFLLLGILKVVIFVEIFRDLVGKDFVKVFYIKFLVGVKV